MEDLIGTRLGNFTLTRRLGEGGMGTVFLAEHNLITRKKAVKVLGVEAARSNALVRRFFDEAVAASACQHDHIVEIEDCGTFPALGRDWHYIEMEFLDGQDLGAACRALPDHRFEDFDRAVKIIGYAADALAAAHARGVVHRDVKPENLFLANRGTRADYLKVLDFGIARLTGDLAPGARTRTGQIMGTPEYMSPEQASGLRPDGEADVWSLAVVLYRMLAGTLPFVADTFTLLVVKLRNEEPIPLGALRPDVPRGLLRAVDVALRKNPAQRPSMADWRDLLLASDAAPRAILPELSIRSPAQRSDVHLARAATELPTAAAPDEAIPRELSDAPTRALPLRHRPESAMSTPTPPSGTRRRRSD